MPKPLKPLESDAGSKKEVLNALVSQMLSTYSVVCLAERINDPELFRLASCYTFDLIDWGRTHIDGFCDELEFKAFNIACDDETVLHSVETLYQIERELEYKLKRPY